MDLPKENIDPIWATEITFIDIKKFSELAK